MRKARRPNQRAQSSKRNKNDCYLTPQPLADAICARLRAMYPDPAIIYEPSAGTGNFVRAARQNWPQHEICAVDINSRFQAQCMAAGAGDFWNMDWADFLKKLEPTANNILVLGNPPFSLAVEHINVGLDYLFPGSWIAFYLKMNFFGGADREKTLWRQRQLKHVIPIVGRPSFKKTQKAANDTNEYGVFIWEVGWEGPATVEFPHITWKMPGFKGTRSAKA